METAQTPPITSTAQKTSEPYSNEMALLLAKMSQLAYVQFEKSDDDRKTLEEDLLSDGYLLVSVICEGDSQCFLAKNEKTKIAVLSFRGTEPSLTDFGDIWTDLNAPLVRYNKKDKSKIHKGFLKAYMIMEREVSETVNNLFGFDIYITGHSLGGALAVIATEKFQSNSNLKATYTYGSPRVGNDKLGKSIKTPLFRIVNNRDVVTMIPPNLSEASSLLSLYLDNVTSRYKKKKENQNPKAVEVFLKLELFISAIVFGWFFIRALGYVHYGRAYYFHSDNNELHDQYSSQEGVSLSDHTLTLYITHLGDLALLG